MSAESEFDKQKALLE